MTTGHALRFSNFCKRKARFKEHNAIIRPIARAAGRYEAEAARSRAMQMRTKMSAGVE